MTDTEDDQSTVIPSSAVRRQRAPTITIDTSAGEQSDSGRSKPASMLNDPSPIELRAAHSFESRESRPKSPHKVSSPAFKGNDIQPKNFLSVPNTRSRGNSVDSEGRGNSPSSLGGETYIPSPSSSGLGASRTNDNIINDKEALTPNHGTEADFVVAENPFAFSPGQLSKLFPKSLAAFHALGGLNGIEKGLRTDRYSGLSIDEKKLEGSVGFGDAVAPTPFPHLPDEPDSSNNSRRSITRTSTAATAMQHPNNSFLDRKRIFKDNHLPAKRSKTIFELAWIAYNDKVIILLSVAAVVSLALGIYQSINKINGEQVQWVEGVAIMVAIIIVVTVGAANDWQKERQFVKLNKKKDDRKIKVIRSGKSREISVYDVLVGDVVHLEPGDMIPVDGIFISGHNVKCDESSATGESDNLKKTSGDEVYEAIEGHKNLEKIDPFIISGGKVTEGIGTFLVTAVGVNSSYGKTLMSLREPSQTTPLQAKLNVLAEYIAKIGLGAGLVLFIATFIKFLVGMKSLGSAAEKGQSFLQVFIVAVTVVVVAVPEGLPLAVTLALAFATTRMLKDNNLVRLLRACETMGNATTICSDKTGTLTQNKMSTVAGVFGIYSHFGYKKSPDSSTSSSPDSPSNDELAASDTDEHGISVSHFISSLDSEVKSLLMQSIAVNSTAFEGEQDGHDAFVGSKTETALLSFARDYLAMGPVSEERSNANVVQMVPFDSGRKCMAAVVKLDAAHYRMLVKGASEIMLGKCSRIIEDPTGGVTDKLMTEENMKTLTGTITTFASRSLRTIGLLYRDFEQWPPKGAPTQEDDPKSAVFDKIFKDMVFLGVVGIQDPLRVGVADAVRACQKAGVFVRMVTGDNLLTAKAIAEECGILTAGGLVLEGPQFRQLDSPERRAEMFEVIPRLQVLARSSPQDKKMLVKYLKERGETVAVTGDGTNDAPALKAADVGFSMGIAGTEVAKEASAIVLMDDNFASIVKAIMWGRAVNDSVKKFLQFQITVNITAVVLTFISAVASSSESSVLTAVQLLWVNLIMDTFAALALATDPPTSSILDRNPEPKSAPLITLTMWKMIIGQSLFQLVITLIMNFAGATIFNYSGDDEVTQQLPTAIFNTFVWMQIFNQYNNRRLDNKFNIFEGVQRNWFFIGIQFIIIAGQVIIVEFGSTAFSTVKLDAFQWTYSVVLGIFSLPVAVLIRCIPDEFIHKLIPSHFKRKRPTPQFIVSDEDQPDEWNAALEGIRKELSVLKILRGGRLQALKYKLQHPREILMTQSRSGSRSRPSSRAHTPAGEPSSSNLSVGQAPPAPESRRSTTRRIGRSRSNSAFAPAAAMAGIVAGSVGGWSPIGRREGEASPRNSHTQERMDLKKPAGLEIHPAKNAPHPIVAADPQASRELPSQVPELTQGSGPSSAIPERSLSKGLYKD